MEPDPKRPKGDILEDTTDTETELGDPPSTEDDEVRVGGTF